MGPGLELGDERHDPIRVEPLGERGEAHQVDEADRLIDHLAVVEALRAPLTKRGLAELVPEHRRELHAEAEAELTHGGIEPSPVEGVSNPGFGALDMPADGGGGDRVERRPDHVEELVALVTGEHPERIHQVVAQIEVGVGEHDGSGIVDSDPEVPERIADVIGRVPRLLDEILERHRVVAGEDDVGGHGGRLDGIVGHVLGCDAECSQELDERRHFGVVGSGSRDGVHRDDGSLSDPPSMQDVLPLGSGTHPLNGGRHEEAPVRLGPDRADRVPRPEGDGRP